MTPEEHLQRMTSHDADLRLDGSIDALERYGNRLEQDFGRDRCNGDIAAMRFAQRAIRERDVLLFLVANVIASGTPRPEQERLLRAAAADVHGLPIDDPRRQVGGPALPGIVAAAAVPVHIPHAGPYADTAKLTSPAPLPEPSACPFCRDVLDGDHPNPESQHEWWAAGHHVCGYEKRVGEGPNPDHDALVAVLSGDYDGCQRCRDHSTPFGTVNLGDTPVDREYRARLDVLRANVAPVEPSNDACCVTSEGAQRGSPIAPHKPPERQ